MEAKLSNQTKTCSSIVKLVCSVLYCIDELALFTFFLLACLHILLKNIKWTELYMGAALLLGLFKKPKCVRSSDFAHFWKAEMILNQSYFIHFFLKWV